MATTVFFREDIDQLRIVAFLLDIGEMPPPYWLKSLIALGWIVPDPRATGGYSVTSIGKFRLRP